MRPNANTRRCPRVADVFAALNATLAIDWLVDQLSRMTPSSLWQAMERDLLLDDLMMDQAALAARIDADLVANGETAVDGAAIDRWIAAPASVHANVARDDRQRATRDGAGFFVVVDDVPQIGRADEIVGTGIRTH